MIGYILDRDEDKIRDSSSDSEVVVDSNRTVAIWGKSIEPRGNLSELIR